MSDPTLSKEQQTDTLARYLPGGRMFGSKFLQTSNLRMFLRGLAEEVFRADELIRLFRSDVLPDRTEFFIDEWESAVGIPDTCYDGTGTDAERRTDIQAKLAFSGLQLAPDFVDFAALFGVVCTAEPGLTVYPGTIADITQARFTIVINFDLPADLMFTYTFPITFGDGALNKVQCLFQKLKPANVDLLFTNL